MIKWQYKSFEQLTVNQLYDILKLRQDVFVIEQQCIYPDIDQVDKTATHLFAYDDQGQAICAYLRMLAPGVKYRQVAMGRILTSESSRGTGLGKVLVQEALQVVEREYPKQAIKISAQVYLLEFYRDFDFVVISEPYDEDGIQHIDMLRS
ncbi:MAG: ElaA protein [Arenicella sp.]|jgi:ElaA protein